MAMNNQTLYYLELIYTFTEYRFQSKVLQLRHVILQMQIGYMYTYTFVQVLYSRINSVAKIQIFGLCRTTLAELMAITNINTSEHGNSP